MAAEILLMAAEGRGPIMHARIAILRALNYDAPPRAPEPRRKCEVCGAIVTIIQLHTCPDKRCPYPDYPGRE